MLTRLKVTGFKNLVDVDVHFGAFTCVAGANGVGKSNLFDAIRFLSALADHSLIDAARMVRDDAGNNWDVRSLFHRVGSDFSRTMSFTAEMVVPKCGHDEITQSEVKATSTLLRYELKLVYDATANGGISHPLRILSEKLVPIPRGDRDEILRFDNKRAWGDSIIDGRRTVAYISTPDKSDPPIIHLHQDKQKSKGGGRSFQHPAASLNRTVISLTNSSETPTALLAKREMQSWRLLQLEPSSLRQQDSFLAPRKLSANGSHLPATLYRLAHSASVDAHLDDFPEPQVYSRVANRLYDLLGEVARIRVDRDDKRDLLTLEITDKSGTTFPAKALSDGTLRFLALSILAEDPEAVGVICFEEPENGIHPKRIPAILKLLRDIAVDTNEPVNEENPLRQVIVNTHSPGVVGGMDDDDLIVARLVDTIREGQRFQRIQFACLTDTWRSKISGAVISNKGELLDYLRPIDRDVVADDSAASENGHPQAPKRRRRVADRPDMRSLFDDIPEPA